jgi:hypothetical protein
MVMRAQGADTPFEPKTSEEHEENEEEEGEVTLPPHSPLREALPRLATCSVGKRGS